MEEKQLIQSNDIIHVYGAPPAFGMITVSPFSIKLETYMKMAGITNYQFHPMLGAKKSPTGKVPFIKYNESGQFVSDSSLIIEHFKKTIGDPLNAKLDSKQRAVSLAWQRLIEEHLYFCVLHYRWVDQIGFAQVSDEILKKAPAAIKCIATCCVLPKIRKQQKK